MTVRDHVIIGRVVKPHGIRGEVKVVPLSDVPDRFKRLKAVWIEEAGKGLTPFRVRKSRTQNELVILSIEGVDTPEEAAELAGRELLVPKDESPELPEGVFYWHDILGMEVATTDGRILGRVTDIFQTGSNDVYVVEDGAKEVLVPAIADVIRKVDVAEKKMIIHPMPGLLDED